MSTIAPSLRQRVWDFCSVPRSIDEIREHTGCKAAQYSTEAMVTEGMLRRTARGVYMRTDRAPKGKGHGRGRGKAITIGSATKPAKFVGTVNAWQPTAPQVATMGNVRVTVAPTPPGRYEVRDAPRTFDFAFERERAERSARPGR
jgi:hypothetical protein